MCYLWCFLLRTRILWRWRLTMLTAYSKTKQPISLSRWHYRYLWVKNIIVICESRTLSLYVSQGHYRYLWVKDIIVICESRTLSLSVSQGHYRYLWIKDIIVICESMTLSLSVNQEHYRYLWIKDIIVICESRTLSLYVSQWHYRYMWVNDIIDIMWGTIARLVFYSVCYLLHYYYNLTSLCCKLCKKALRLIESKKTAASFW